MKYSVLIQTLPSPSAESIRLTVETNVESEARDWLTHYAELYQLPLDPAAAFNPKIGLYNISAAGGFPFIEFKKRISI